jgi:WD40 repeat protein
MTSSGSVRLWQVNTGKELWEANAVHRGMSSSTEWCPLAFSPDGKMLAFGSVDEFPTDKTTRSGSVHLWDVPTGRELRKITGFAGNPTTLRFTPDGRLVVNCGESPGQFSLLEPKTGARLARYEGPAAYSHGRYLAVSADGKVLTSVQHHETQRGRVIVCCIETASGKELSRRELMVLSPEEAEINLRRFYALTHEGQLLAVTAPDGKAIHLWEPAAGRKLRDIDNVGAIPTALAFSADGRALAASGKDGGLRVWDITTGTLTREFPGTGIVADQLAFSPDGKILVSINEYDGALRMWDVAGGKELHTFAGHRSGPLAVAFDGQTVLTACRSRGSWSTSDPGPARSDSSLRRWDSSTGAETSAFPIPLRGWGLYNSFSSDGKLFAGADEDGNLLVLDTTTGKEVSRWRLPKREEAIRFRDKVEMRSFMDFRDLRFSADNKILMATGGKVILYDVAAGKERGRLTWDKTSYSRSVMTPDQKGLVLLDSAHGKHPLVLRDAQTGQEIRKVGEGGDFTRPIALSPNGRTVVTGGPFSRDPSGIRLWELASGRERGKLASSPQRVTASVFAPNGKLLALGDRDGRVGLWDMASCKQLGQAKGHRASVISLAFSADGRLLASSGDENFALVWEVSALTGRADRVDATLGDEQLRRLWRDLASADASDAYSAIWRLSAAPEKSVPFLRDQLRPSDLNARLARLVADLDDERFSVREQASAELEALGTEAESALRAALEKAPPAEVQRRVKRLLGKLGTGPSGELLRQVRAVEALEHCGTRDAKVLLESLAKGASAARLTQEARASLRRLGN